MYCFSSLALTLNEEDEGVCWTDSRLRPDQRLMEAGRWDEANVEKQRLEEKQRATRRKREAEASKAIDEGERRSKVTQDGHISDILTSVTMKLGVLLFSLLQKLSLNESKM